MDVSPNRLAKTNRLAEKRGVTIETIEADLNDFVFPEPMDVMYSIGTVQYLQPENWKRGFERFRRGTAPGGVHVIFAFVDHPNVPTPPDWTESEFFYAVGELRATTPTGRFSTNGR
jgi:tellurite methyltransferase